MLSCVYVFMCLKQNAIITTKRLKGNHIISFACIDAPTYFVTFSNVCESFFFCSNEIATLLIQNALPACFASTKSHEMRLHLNKEAQNASTQLQF